MQQHQNQPSRTYLHQLIRNIQFEKQKQNGQYILKREDISVGYIPPLPPPGSGQHKYTFYLYEQSGKNLAPILIWNNILHKITKRKFTTFLFLL